MGSSASLETDVEANVIGDRVGLEPAAIADGTGLAANTIGAGWTGLAANTIGTGFVAELAGVVQGFESLEGPGRGSDSAGGEIGSGRPACCSGSIVGDVISVVVSRPPLSKLS